MTISSVEAAVIRCFQEKDLETAAALVPELPQHEGFSAHPTLRAFVEQNDGHCHNQVHLQIADLLIPAKVRSFRSLILSDNVREAGAALNDSPDLVHSEFTAGRGIAQPIHHWESTSMGELLIEAGADVNAMTSVHGIGETALATQVRFGSLEGICLLLERGADPNHGCCRHMPSDRMRETIDLLLEFNWDLQRQAQLLHDAHHGHGSRIAIWLEYGVDPNLTDETGRSALHYLAARGTGRSAIRALASAGADLNLRSADGLSPLAIARSANRPTAAQTLRELGAQE